MKFLDKYPDARYLDHFKYDKDIIIKSIRRRFCYICGSGAVFTSDKFDVFLCSEECLEKLWNRCGESIEINLYDKDTDELEDYL